MKTETISSIGYDQIVMIQNIIKLHVPQGFIDLDPTYSKGVFYKNGLIKDPVFKFDIKPQTEDTIKACATDIPLNNDSVNCIMFDPPFVMGSGPSIEKPKEGGCLTIQRFSCFKNPKELLSFYNAAIKELYRVLNTNGVFIFKCQDCVIASKNLMSHVVVMQQALNAGFYPKDLFVLASKSRLLSGKVKKQQHARKYHSYFWVFEKKKSKLDYNLLIGK